MQQQAAQLAGKRFLLPELHRNISLAGKRSLAAEEVLADKIGEMPADRLPVVLAGGSFNHDNRASRMTDAQKHAIDLLLEQGNPEKLFFVIGHALRGYEGYLAEKNHGRFLLFAIVPARITREEYRRLRRRDVKIRVAIETVPMGIYKSFAYEIFKRRTSVLLALDGNSAGANLIQEAKNSRYFCRIYVNHRCRALRIKAESLEGYVTLFDGAPEEVLIKEMLEVHK